MARHLIIGGGTAGLNAIRTIREEDGGASEITLVSMERPYSRMVLPYYLGETISESHVFTATPASLAAWKVKTTIGRKATALNAKANTVTLDDGSAVEYDDCLIATGSRAARPPIPGADGPGVHSFWTLDEARKVIEQVTRGSHVVMVGAGFISFTILNAILARGAKLTIVEVAAPHPAPDGGRGLRGHRGPLATPARGRDSRGGQRHQGGRGEGQAEALLQDGRAHRGGRGDHGHRYPDQSRVG